MRIAGRDRQLSPAKHPFSLILPDSLIQPCPAMHDGDDALSSDSPLDDESAPASFTIAAVAERGSDSDSESPLPDLQPHPFHFHHQPEFQSKECHVVAKLICSTCSAHKCNFYCFSCVNRGEFTSSQSSQMLKEKFCEKKLQLFALLQDKQHIFHLIETLLQPSVQIDQLQSQVNLQTQRNLQLKQDLQLRRTSLQQLRGRKVDIKLVQQQARQLRDLNSLKVASAEKAIQQIREKVCNKRVGMTGVENSLRELTWDFSAQLRSNIFTLESYEPEENEGNTSNAESIPLLGYSASHYAPGARRSEMKITIVEPWLPAAPDWSAYSSWVSSHKEEIGSSASLDSLEKRNDAFRISAALSYIAHLTDVLARVLDVHLPRKLNFKEFYTKSSTGVEEFLSETQMRHKVAKLDANVSFLCLSQKMDPHLISIRQSAHNLMNLLNPSVESDLGRRGRVSIDPDFAMSLSALLSDDLSLVQEEAELDFEYDAQLDVDELGYEAIPLWGHDGAHDFHDQSMMQANSMLSPASVLTSAVSFFDVSRFWATTNNP